MGKSFMDKKVKGLFFITCTSLVACSEDPSKVDNILNNTKHIISQPVNPNKKLDEEVKDEEPDKKLDEDEDKEESEEPEEPEEPSAPPKSDIERKLDEVKSYIKEVNNDNFQDFQNKAEEFFDVLRENGQAEKLEFGEENKIEINDNKVTGDVLGAKIDIDLAVEENFDQNIERVCWFNEHGADLKYPLNKDTFPKKIDNDFINNLRNIQSANAEPQKQFSVEEGIVKLDGEEMLKLDSLDNFINFFNALSEKNLHGFFDESCFDNIVSWISDEEIRLYGKYDVKIFEKLVPNQLGDEPSEVLEDNRNENLQNLLKLFEVLYDGFCAGINIEIQLEQKGNEIKLGGQVLNNTIWENSKFWGRVNFYSRKKFFRLPEKIKVKKDGNDSTGALINDHKIQFRVNKMPEGIWNNNDLTEYWSTIFCRI